MILQPEHVRKAAMDKYADLQVFKLKVAIILGLLVWGVHYV